MPTIYYIGDSTVARNTIHTYPQTGLAQGLEWYLREGVRMACHGKNGRSTKSFLDEGRFAPVAAAMQPGDFLLIQFGHNDQKPDAARHTDPDTTFRENLLLFIHAAQRAGAYPVLITPIERRHFDENGVFLPGSHGPYPEAMRRLGAEVHVPVLDMTARTGEFLSALGDEASRALFMWPDNTHLRCDGAVQLAGLIAEELEKLGAPYADLLAPPEEDA